MTQQERESPEELLDAWDQAMAEADHAVRTRKRYVAVLRGFITYWCETHPELPFDPQALTPISATAYRQHVQREAAPSTVNVHVSALRAFGGWLVDAGYVTTNFAERVRTVTVPAVSDPKALEDRHVHALIRETRFSRHAARDRAILQVLVQTGIRIGECGALTVGDIEIGERQGMLLIRHAKGLSARGVPLNASARLALAEYLGPRWGTAPTVRAVAAAWPTRNRGEPLWCSQQRLRAGEERTAQLSVRAIAKLIDALVADCARRGLVPEDTTPHAIRHTFATNYLKDHPGDLVGLAAILGHRTIRSTLLYVQPTAAELRQRMERLRLNAYS